jgi:hypothetical protein
MQFGHFLSYASNIVRATRYHSVVKGLINNYVSLNGRDVGECIYCGERNGSLATEHAVPYGLNGPWTLLRASCGTCAKITTRFEHDAMRRLWPDGRNVLAMQSRRRDKRSATLPLVLQRDGLEEVVQVPRTKFPTYLGILRHNLPTLRIKRRSTSCIKQHGPCELGWRLRVRSVPWLDH